MSEQLPPDVLARRDALPLKPYAPVIAGTRVTLRPLNLDEDLDELFAHSAGDADMWRHMSAGPFADAAELGAWLAKQMASPDACSLAMIVDGKRMGVATMMANQPAHLKIELGNIWLSAGARGTGAMREATHLMCAHAFALGYRRVEWKCDALNARSRAAALSYGAVFEGIQDAHFIVKGRNRDTAWFRWLDREWPDVLARCSAGSRS